MNLRLPKTFIRVSDNIFSSSNNTPYLIDIPQKLLKRSRLSEFNAPQMGGFVQIVPLGDDHLELSFDAVAVVMILFK